MIATFCYNLSCFPGRGRSLQFLSSGIVVLLLWIAGYPAFAQESNWEDTLHTLLASGKADSVIAAQLGDKAFVLTSLRKLPEADKFLAAQMSAAKRSGSKSEMAYAWYNHVVRNYFTLPRDSVFSVLKLAIGLSESGGKLLYRIKAYRTMAQYCESNSRIEEALSYVRKAEEYAVLLKDENELAKTNLTYGIVLSRTEKQKQALEKYIAAINYLENSKDYRSLAVAYNAVANILLDDKDYEGAWRYYFRNMNHCLQNFRPYLSTAYLGVATYHYTLLNRDSALKYYQLAEEAMHASNEFSRLHVVYSNKATIYQELRQLDSSAVYHVKTIELAEQMNKIGFLGRLYSNYSSFLLQRGDLDSALAMVNNALLISQEEMDDAGYAGSLRLKAEVLTAMNDFQGAGKYYNRTIEYKDSVFVEEKKREINRLAVEYESAKKENEINRLNSERKIQLLEIEKKNALLKGNQERARQKQSEIDLLNKEKIIGELKLQQQKEELNRKIFESEAKEHALTLSRQKQELQDREIERQRSAKNMIVLGAAVLLLFLLLVFNQYRISRERKAEGEKHLLHHQLSELKIEALRAQMNPHFLFNALNSINRYIIRSDKETASDYLVKFSKLMRLVLENSKSSVVTLHHETDALRLYIELEQLRFDHKFDYSIVVDPAIDSETTFIPPLVLQPYVENAIWHGLLNKNGKGRVDIHIRKRENNRIFCVIEDNGVGRQKAAELKSKTLGSNKSFGTEITRERINLLNGDDKNFKIIDLYDANNQATGTRVEIVLNAVNKEAA